MESHGRTRATQNEDVNSVIVRCFWVSTVFALGLCAQNPEPAAQPSASPRMMEIPLLDCSGLPCIDMSAANGKTLRLLIDTGEANSYLDMKAAQTLGLELKPLKGSGDS